MGVLNKKIKQIFFKLFINLGMQNIKQVLYEIKQLLIKKSYLLLNIDDNDETSVKTIINPEKKHVNT